MITIGLTGGIGSGKSTVANLFKALDVPVFDTDTIARQLVEPGQPALEEIKTVFGNEILDATGNLDRDKLKRQIFNNVNDRQTLESILHPRIRDSLLNKIKHCKAPYCIAVIPLLVEHQWQHIVDRVLVVDASEDTQMRRIRQRDGMPDSLTRSIINSQVSRQARLAAADDVIDNDQESNTLNDRVKQLHEKYMAIADRK